MKVVKNPEIVDAVIFTNDATSYQELKQLGYGDVHLDIRHSIQLIVPTDCGSKRANIGDYIVKETSGDFYAYSPEEFNLKYKYIDGEDSVRQFIEECLILGDGDLNMISTNLIYRQFLAYCDHKELFMAQPKDFNIIIKSYGLNIRIDENKDCCYNNVKLKNVREVKV